MEEGRDRFGGELTSEHGKTCGSGRDDGRALRETDHRIWKNSTVITCGRKRKWKREEGSRSGDLTVGL